ncbi:MAG: transcription antitermination factor NusB [Treponema sp.]|nr:transcription antitermination factor NusB [Treponema sp.]
MSRRKGRVLAFQTLYAHDVGGAPVEDLLPFLWVGKDGVKAEHAEREEYVFARLLVAGALEHCAEIDAAIDAHLAANWNFDRVNKVSLAILRMSVYSLLYQKEIPASVTIDEAVRIAKEYGDDDSFKFINAMLDSIRKAMLHET